MKPSLLVSALMAVVLASACDRQERVVYQTAPAPMQQQPVVVHESGIGTGTALVGAAAVGTAAYLAGKAAGQNQAPTYSQPVAPAPAATAPRYYSSNTTTTPVAPKPAALAPKLAEPKALSSSNLQPTKVVAPRTTSSSSSGSKINLSKR